MEDILIRSNLGIENKICNNFEGAHSLVTKEALEHVYFVVS